MPSFQKVFLRISGRIGDTPADPDKLPDRVLATGTAFLKPNIKDGWAEQTTGPDGLEELMLPSSIQCVIEDGWLTYNGDPYVWLLVGEENWNWNISFPQIRINNVAKKLDAFNFDLEPASDDDLVNPSYAGVNLALLQEFTDPDTGNKAVRGPRGYGIDGASIVGDEIILSLDDPLNTSLPGIEIPAIAAANDAAEDAISAKNLAQGFAVAAATSEDNAEIYKNQAQTAKTDAEAAQAAAEDAVNSFDLTIGTTTTIPTGQPATASLTGTPPNKVLNLGLPQGEMGPAGTSPDASTTTKGIVQLTGPLGGTASAPTITAGAIGTSQLADGSVTSSKIADGTIVNADINASAAIAGSKIADTSITGSKLTNDTITSTQIGPNAVTSSELADDAVDTAAIQGSAVTGPKIATGAVDSSKIADGTIVDADINASAAIALSKLATGRVQGSKNGVPTSITIWTGTEAQYNTATSNGTAEDPNTLYFRST